LYEIQAIAKLIEKLESVGATLVFDTPDKHVYDIEPVGGRRRKGVKIQ
jgi:hypothetical protein